MKLDVIKYKAIFLGLSIALVAASLASVAIFDFKLGIDFTGGSLWQLKIEGANARAVQDFFRDDLKLEAVSISYDPINTVYSLSLSEISDSDRQLHLELLEKKFGEKTEEYDFWAISPSVSDEINKKALSAVAFVLIGISAYIAFAFRKVSRPISSWKYGAITLITLLHDVAIPAGVFALLGKYMGVTLDTTFIVAMLVVMGFSVHDTIVVFDRVRENLAKSREKNLPEVVNASVNETIRRSINTSLTLIVILVTLFFFGPPTLKFFILAMLIGTTAGTYSSIFVASPLLVVVQKLGDVRK